MEIEHDRGKRHRIQVEGENIYLFIGENGYHEITIPDENRKENKTERLHMDAVMQKLSEIHGYVEEKEQ